jgi:16S rRNA (uracil1498-N3)-methyltransferase
VLPRFFVPQAETTGSVVALPDDEAAHLIHVLRLKPGDAVRVFDGRGREWSARVGEIGKAHARVQLDASLTPIAEPQVVVTLAVAVLKGDKMDDVVRDAVMLGVRRVVTLLSERTEIAPRLIQRGQRVERWRRIAVASAKQCGRSVIPGVDAPISVQEALAESSAAPRIMLVEPGANEVASRRLRDLPRSQEAVLFIGPEGGWSSREVELAGAAGVHFATLGLLTLRADAAPLVAVTALRTTWDDL